MNHTVHKHFSEIAQIYNDLRSTDKEPVAFIEQSLRHLPRIEAADVGCGSGRYSLEFLRLLGEKIFLTCLDANREMLTQLQKNLTEQSCTSFKTVRAVASDMSIDSGTLDAIVTFDAIHHFDLKGFLKEAARTLKDEGYLFIYTRTREQNRRHVWGRYFPSFCEMENRLYELEQLENEIEMIPNLHLSSVENFQFKRHSSLELLINQAKKYHYSTFRLYDPDEFDKALKDFEQNIRSAFPDPNDLTLDYENTLMVIRT